MRDLASAHGVDAPEPHTGEALGYRHRARLSVRGRANSPKIGIFQEGTHRIVDIPRCPVHHPRINETAAALKRVMRAEGAAPYADRPHRGLVRSVQVVVERPTQRVQVVLVTNSEGPEPAARVLEGLRVELGEALHSLWWNGNPERVNTILGAHWECVTGPPAVEERIGGAAVYFPPGAFGQANLPLADRLVERVAAWVAPQKVGPVLAPDRQLSSWPCPESRP